MSNLLLDDWKRQTSVVELPCEHRAKEYANPRARPWLRRSSRAATPASPTCAVSTEQKNNHATPPRDSREAVCWGTHGQSVSWPAEHTLAVPLQFPQAESPNIRITGLRNAVDTTNQFLPSRYKGLLSVTLLRTALCLAGRDGGRGTGFLIILRWNYQDYTYIVMRVVED